MASVRGIGVADIISMCGRAAEPPLRPASPPGLSCAGRSASSSCRAGQRCSTPKRCCSSITASASAVNCTWSWITAWVPITSAASPLATSSSISARSFLRWLPVSHATRRPRGASSGSSQPISLRKVLLRQDLGRRHQRALPARVDRDAAASAATMVLPEPTSPCSSRCMGGSRARLAAISSLTRRCAPVSWNGSGRKQLLVQAARRGAQGGRCKASCARRLSSCDSCCGEQFLRLQPLPGRMAAVLQRGQRDLRRRVMQERSACRRLQLVAVPGAGGASAGMVSDRSARARPLATALRR
jgi:hypothetical protein